LGVEKLDFIAKTGNISETVQDN